jgi:two-component system NtrC family response regulator
VLLSDEDRVSEEDLPQEVAGRPPCNAGFQLPPGGLAWDAHERDCLGQALAMAGGNRARAARLLDMPYKAFLYRMEKHGLGGDGD